MCRAWTSRLLTATLLMLAVAGSARAQGPITNGENHAGSISAPGEIDDWTFTAAQGLAISLSIGEVLPVGPDPGFTPWIRLVGPDGSELASSSGALVAQINLTTPLGGSYTVRVASNDPGNDGVGDYLLTLAQVPGTFVVPSGDDGGAMVNGENHAGRIHVGDLDQWTFVASSGDAISVSIGEVFETPGVDPGFTPWIRLLGPTGELIDSSSGALVGQINVANAAVSGTLTVIVSTNDPGHDGAGLYRLVLAKTPGTFVVPGGDQGGVMTNGTAHAGEIHLGDLDLWSFGAAAGVAVTVSIGEVLQMPDPGFTPWIRLRRPDGVLVGSSSGATTAQINMNTPVTGIYTVVVSTNDPGHDGVGLYQLTVSGALVPPTASDDAYQATLNTALVITAPGVLANDDAHGGTPLTAQIVTATTQGALTLSPDGGLLYTPSPGFLGVDTFTYRALSLAGPGNVATVTITVNPFTALPPVSLYAASIAGNLVTLRWTPPAAGLAPTGYVLEGGVNPGDVLASIGTGSTTPIFSFLAPTGAFYVRVHTLSGATRSAASNEIRIFVNVPAAPSAPANLVGLANGSSIALAWRNTFAGGAPGGVVLDVSGSLSASLPLGLTDTFQFNGVPGGNYTFSVRALNAVGSSPPSNAVALSFPSPTCSGAPLPPAAFLAYRVGNTLTVLWEPATSGPAPTSFVLNVSGAFSGSFATPGRAVSGAVGPGSYTLSVAAANACGTSAPTPPQTVVVP